MIEDLFRSGPGDTGHAAQNLQHIPHFFHGTVFDSRLVIGESDDSGHESCLDQGMENDGESRRESGCFRGIFADCDSGFVLGVFCRSFDFSAAPLSWWAKKKLAVWEFFCGVDYFFE